LHQQLFTQSNLTTVCIVYFLAGSKKAITIFISGCTLLALLRRGYKRTAGSASAA